MPSSSSTLDTSASTASSVITPVPLLRPRSAARFWLLIVSLVVTLVIAIVLAVAVGAVAVPFSIVTRVILAHLLPGAIVPDWTPTQDQIV
ncbi:MAG: hypothetical protein H7Y32_08960, partial [Chloroflexales bacterium]|nr:hypothetical protein [Chloroflexales bacterium]